MEMQIRPRARIGFFTRGDRVFSLQYRTIVFKSESFLKADARPVRAFGRGELNLDLPRRLLQNIDLICGAGPVAMPEVLLPHTVRKQTARDGFAERQR